MLADFFHHGEKAPEVFAGSRRQHDHRRVIEKEEFVAHALHMLAQEVGAGVLPARDEIPFVEDNDGGLAGFLDEPGDFFVLGGHATRGVDHQDVEVRAADRFLRTHHAEDFDRGVVPRAVADAGRVAKDVIAPLALRSHIDGVARGAGDFTHRRAAVAENGINE